MILTLCYNLSTNLRGMNFLVFPYNTVLNVCVFYDAIVADGHIWANGAILDDHVHTDVARGDEFDIAHEIVVGNVAYVVEQGLVLQ